MWFLYCIPLLCLALWIFQKQHDKFRKLPPGPYRFPLIGCMLQILAEDKVFPFLAFMKLSKYYESDVIYLQIGVVKAVAINGYAACKEILSSNDWIGRMHEKWQLDRTYGKPLGLISAEVDIWKETRPFSTRLLREYGFGVKKTVEILLAEELEEICTNIRNKLRNNNGIVSAQHLFSLPLLNTVWSMVSGIRHDLNDPKLTQIAQLIDQFFKTGSFGAGLLTAYPFLVDWAPKLVGFDKQQKINAASLAYFENLLREVRAEGNYLENPTNFIEAYLQKIDNTKEEDPDKEIYCDENLISVLYDFFFGAAETTENILSFGILHLILNPHIQNKMFEEIKSVVGLTRWPLKEDKENMPYTSAAILELYRISSVVPVGPRQLHKDATVGPYKVPKGTTVLVNYYSVAMDPKVWKDPHEFRPERFLNAQGQVINADQIFPFSAGRRNCVGETVARLSHFIMVVGLLQHFKFEVNSEEGTPSREVNLGFTISPKPFTFKVTERAY